MQSDTPNRVLAGAQERLLLTYTILRLLRPPTHPDWGGALLVSCGLNPHGASFALAANLAGAVCLSLEEDPATLKAALRSGSCDFIVNTLDEAVRTMKNEVRKHQPLAVGLLGKPFTVLNEILDRGLKPDAFTDFNPTPTDPATSFAQHQQFRSLYSLGTLLLDFQAARLSGPACLPGDETIPDDHFINVHSLLADFLEHRHWQLHSFPIKDPAARKNFEVYAISLLAEDDVIRRTWLHSAHRLLPRERPLRRTLWVSHGERELIERSFPPDSQ